MRSVDEWTKFLERQEQLTKQASAVTQEHEPEAVRETKAQPVTQTRIVEKVVSVAKPEPAAKPVVQQQTKQAPARRPTSGRDARSTVRHAGRPGKTAAKPVETHDNGSEVAQNSYKPFRETREQLLERLLDPELSLEEAARVLNVCPTTVRRYTNKGVLRHFRTAGNQRRFKLSDLLRFLEAQGGESVRETVVGSAAGELIDQDS